ncbi:MAG: RNA polymerase sigma factor [Candidatus Zhuqueibacterota bacterium]
MTDEELLKKYQQLGDIESLNELFQRYLERTYAYFIDKIRDRGDIEDVVQNVFLKIIRTVNAGKKIKSFKDYLFICCRNAFCDYLRRKKTGTMFQNSESANGESYIDLVSFVNWQQTESPGLITQAELELALNSCISNFPQEHIRNILLDYVHGFSLKKIAQRNNCPPTTAGSIWHRQKVKLFRCILKKLGKI